MKKESNTKSGMSREEILTLYRNHALRLEGKREKRKKEAEEKANVATAHEKLLARSAIIWTDEHGEILNKLSNPVHRVLEMLHTDKDIKVVFRVMEAAQGNGSAKVRVWYKNRLVFHAHGNQHEWCMEVNSYEPGDWENLIPKTTK